MCKVVEFCIIWTFQLLDTFFADNPNGSICSADDVYAREKQGKQHFE